MLGKSESFVARWEVPGAPPRPGERFRTRHFTSRDEAINFLVRVRFPVKITNRDRRVVGWSQRSEKSSSPGLTRWLFVWEDPRDSRYAQPNYNLLESGDGEETEREREG